MGTGGSHDVMSTQGFASFKELTPTSNAKDRNVTINPLPQVVCYDNSDNSTEGVNSKSKLDTITSKHINNINDMPSNKDLTYLFYSNVSSLSRAARDYIFTLPREVRAVALAECHRPKDEVEGKFSRKGFTVEYNVPEESPNNPNGTHGGELIGVRNGYTHRKISQDLLDVIIKYYGILRFSAMILSMQGVEFVFATVYLWHTEGFTERNITILYQLQYIQRLTKLPIIIAGDFNIPYQSFAESGWCERLNVRMVHPGVKSTTLLSNNRVIDFVLISPILDHLFRGIIPITTVPWWPHIAFLIVLVGKPRRITGLVQCIPRKLPMNLFKPEWEKIEPDKQISLWCKAVRRARNVLIKQKSKTGIGILGSPNEVLDNDVKFQGQLRAEQIHQGESLALAALATEFLVLDIIGINRKLQHHYTGRSQYPVFKTKPILSKPRNDICSEFENSDLVFWGELKGLVAHMRPHFHECKSTDQALTLTNALKAPLSFAEHHVEELPEDLQCEALVLSRLVPCDNAYALSRIYETITQIYKFMLNKLNSDSKHEYKKYVRSELSRGGGKLFKYISSEEKRFLQVHYSSHSSAKSHEEFMNQQVGIWSKCWCPKDVEHLRNKLAIEFKHLWEFAKQDVKHSNFDEDTLTDVVHSYNKNTLGTDIWAPSELDELPECSKRSLSTCCHNSVQSVVVPHQSLLNANSLLGKHGNKIRTISLTPVLTYRMPLRADHHVRDWEKDNIQPYDKASVGASALTAALNRNLRGELAFWLKRHFAAIFNDFEKFFDTLSIQTLMEEAIHTGFPIDKLCFALQQHLAPRVLQSSGCASEPIEVFQSIIAGCKFSKALTQAYMMRGMKRICDKHSEANPELFVDDSSMHAAADSWEGILNNLVPAMLTFKDVVAILKLKLSPKAAITASDVKLLKFIIQELKTYDLFFEEGKHARDLGVSNTAGNSRPFHLVNSRFDKTKPRKQKIVKLARVCRLARKLFTGSAFTASVWGHQASGLTDDQIKTLERDATASTGIKPRGRCRQSALLICFGPNGSPRARVVRELLRSWFELLRSAPQADINDIRSAWARAKSQLNEDLNIKHVHGIMSNVIYTLLKAKWVPVLYNMWESPEGVVWEITDFHVSPDLVAAAVTLSFFTNGLTSMSQHYDGIGIENGIDIDASLKYPRSLKYDYSVSYSYKAAIETIFAGACWPAARINAIDDTYSSLCPRCNQSAETSFHTFWECPCNALIEDEAIQSTQDLFQQASEQYLIEPCLWLRGMLPSNHNIVPVEHKPISDIDVKYHYADRVNNIIWGSGVYYGDASGGKHTSYKSLRRCGIACVCFIAGIFHFGFSANLPGSIQTVGRGELYALLELTNQLLPHSIVEFVTDNLNVEQTYNKGHNAAINSNNCDLYKIIFDNIRDKHLILTVRWMPSHIKDGKKVRPSSVSDLDILANDKADELAGEAAELYQLPNAIANNIINNYLLVQRIQKRLASILLWLPTRESKSNPNPNNDIIKETKSFLLSQTKHIVQIKNNRYHCKVCLNSFSAADPNAKRWLKSSCTAPFVGTSSAEEKPTKLNDIIHIGNKSSHVSHDLYKYKQTIYCNNCGAHGSAKFVLLSKPCQAAKSAGLRTLSSINSGQS